jgi:uncharacterized protein (TIGR03435 family)
VKMTALGSGSAARLPAVIRIATPRTKGAVLRKTRVACSIIPSYALPVYYDHSMRACSLIVAAVFLFAPHNVRGQAPVKEEFEVAAVKPFAPGGKGPGFVGGVTGGPGTADPNRITFTNLTLKSLAMTAYGIKPYQISAPDWTDSQSARFNIEAAIRPGATKEQVNLMLQNLLAERFKLTLHRETKETSLHELVVGKYGAKLKDAVEDPNARPAMLSGRTSPTGPRRVVARNQTMAQLADQLSSPSFGPVLDKTGLAGKYDFTLEYSPSVGQADAGPDLFAAIQDQLGLKLEAKKSSIEMLVIDHCEKQPTEN